MSYCLCFTSGDILYCRVGLAVVEHAVALTGFAAHQAVDTSSAQRFSSFKSPEAGIFPHEIRKQRYRAGRRNGARAWSRLLFTIQKPAIQEDLVWSH